MPPPRRVTVCRTSASPMPWPVASFVVTPRSKTRSPSRGPGPLSPTAMRSAASVASTATRTVGVGVPAAASSALSMRLPTIVMRSRAGTGVASRRSGRSISKAMPRSLACAALPSSRASSTGSSTAESSRSARAWLRASSELASAAASAGRSSSMRAMIVCSRFANSCACERSASESVVIVSSSP